MESPVTGKTRFERTNPLFLFVNMREFARKVGVNGDAWTNSLREEDPKQILVHMFLTHMDPGNKRDLLVIYPKFTKLVGYFENYIKASLYDTVKVCLDEAATLDEFWTVPEDHTKFKKFDEKIRNLTKSLFRTLMQTYVTDYPMEYVRYAESVRLQGINLVDDGFSVTLGDKAERFSTKPFVSFIRTLAPLANKYPQLYGRVYKFKLHPNGTTIFDMESLQDLVGNKAQKDENLKTFREAMGAYHEMMSAELAVGHFNNVSELSAFLGILSQHIDQYASSAEATNDVTKLRAFLDVHPKFLGRYQEGIPADFLYLLDKVPKETKEGQAKHNQSFTQYWPDDPEITSGHQPTHRDYHSFFEEDEE